MPKNILHDVMTHEHRSIREVPLPGARKKSAKDTPDDEALVYEQDEERTVVEEGQRRGGSWWLWVIAVIFLVMLGFALLSGLRGATVTVTPKTTTANIEQEFTAGSATDAKLRYERLTFTKSLDTQITADTTKAISEKASGTIVIYNDYGSAPQRLIKNTRFESPAGRVYRINQSITVPGQKTEGGKTVPGSLEVEVFADAPGEEYNLALSDFTIPGFKTDPKRYAGFYARSRTAISGGFEGTVKTASDATIAAARETLKGNLVTQLTKQAKAAVPELYLLFDTALVFSYDEPMPTEKNGSLTIKETATATGYLFKRADLAQSIADKHTTAGAQADLPDFTNLNLVWTNTPLANNDATVRFTLNGSAQLVFRYDAEKLRSELLGKPKSEVVTLLSAFPTIEKVEVVLRPFWSSSFSTNPNRVTIK